MTTGYLHRSGTQILDSNNNAVRLVGAFYAVESVLVGYWNPSTMEDDIINVAANGGNSFRINQLDWSLLEPTQGNYSSTMFAYLDSIAGWAQANHVYVIFSTAELCCSNGQANLPSWATAGVSSDPSTFEVGFYDQSNSAYNNARSYYAAFLAYIAARYASNPFVLIELFNEPYISNNVWYDVSDAAIESAHYAATMATLYDAVVAAGYLNPVIIPTPTTAYGYPSYTPEYVDVTRSNIIYDGHAYWCKSTSLDLSHFEDQINQYISYYQTSFGKPVIICEWGYVDSDYYTLNDTFDTWANIQANLQTLMTFLDSSSINGCNWYCWGVVYGSFDPAFTSPESTWLMENVMVGGTGPPSISQNDTLPWSDDFADLDKWIIQDGTWTVAYGILSGSDAAEALITAGNAAWTDYSVTVHTIINPGGATNESSSIVRFTDTNNFYWMGLGLFGHQYSIAKKVAGTYTEIASSGLASSVQQNVTYKVKAVIIGSILQLYINDALVLQVTDSSLSAGALGIRTYNSSIQVLDIAAYVASNVIPLPPPLASAAIITQQTLANTGVLAGVGIQVAPTNIDWGVIVPGTSKTVTVQVTNRSAVSQTLKMVVATWGLAQAQPLLTVTWDRENAVLYPGETTTATLTLTASASTKGDTPFNFSISIVGSA